jgi:hypothetical protein
MRRRDEDRFVAAGRLVDPTGRDSRLDRLGDVLANVVDVEVTFEARAREKPMQIGMLDLSTHAARFALAAGRPVRVLAEQRACEPQCDLLFADATRTLQQQASRQCAAPHRIEEPVANDLMSEEGEQRHERKL